METLALWSQYVFKDTLNIDNEELKTRCYRLRDENTRSNSISNVGGWQSSRFYNTIKRTPGNVDVSVQAPVLLKQLAEQLTPILSDVKTQYKIRNDIELIPSEYWININPEHAWNYPHTHSECIFSGTYYVNVPESGGELIFSNPTPSIYNKIVDICEYMSPVVTEKWVIKPRAGDVVIFPSWLSHFVSPNRSKEDRISIAFNVLAKSKNKIIS